jgi:hypothetical protein
LTLIDTSVLIDILLDDPKWRLWSEQMLDRRAVQGALFISDIVYAELSSHFERERELTLAMASLDIVQRRIPARALFVAGRAFRRYRQAGGPRLSVLPDFFIGAHAQVETLPILTRDTRRYRTYFPDVELIAPEP